ncbi:VanZ family protein [Inconstantimicrobium mannanitabidum]|uniref:Antibiotic resistance protein VanZ n=1 Tax=Inconstantimicrobium mannanitabidum TaxID=1604901 RepID=A0ACB5RCN2_9CLOT|nr:VanZ family protein [Clostridium sp. TW13]GKX67013.1 antibiotic resistance protein VanZ [Clostridium sp. TW13]
MFLDRTFAFVIGLPILLILEVIRYKKSKEKESKFLNYREIGIIIFSLYIISLVAVTQFPFRTTITNYMDVNIVPVFNTIKDMSNIPSNMESFMIRFWIINIVGNLVLLMPLSILVPMLFKKFRSMKKTIILCFLVSVSIEFLQFLSMFCGNRRSVDIDDVILNTLGAVLGFFIFKYLQKIINKKCPQNYNLTM